MIKVINCKTKNYKKKLNSFLDKRRINKNVNTNIVIQILKDVKKNKYKALLKYEKKFSGNNQIKINPIAIKKSINSLDKKTKKAIDFAYNRILKFHKNQKIKNLKIKDNLNNLFEYKFSPIESI